MGGIYELRLEMDSDAIMCIPNFIKIGSGINKLIAGIHRHTDSTMIQLGYFYFIKIRKAGYRLKRAFFVYIYTYRVRKCEEYDYTKFRNLCLNLQINKYMRPSKTAHLGHRSRY
jgi:hypothetical protein